MGKSALTMPLRLSPALRQGVIWPWLQERCNAESNSAMALVGPYRDDFRALAKIPSSDHVCDDGLCTDFTMED